MAGALVGGARSDRRQRAIRYAGRPRPVAHLVPAVAGGGEQLVGELVLVGLQVLVGLGDLAAPDLPGQLRAVLDDQRVRGDVVGPQRERVLEGRSPVGERLPGVP